MTSPHPSLTHTLRTFAATLGRTLPRQALGALALSIVTGLTEGLGTLLLVPLLAVVGLDVSSGGIAQLSAVVRRALGVAGLEATLGPVLLLYVAIVSAQALLGRWQLMTSLALEHRFVAALRRRLFDAFARADWRFQSSMRGSDVSHVMVHELDRVGVATYQVLYAASTTVLVIVYLGIAARVSLLMTALVLCAGGAVLAALSGRVRHAGSRGETVSERTRILYARLDDHLGAARLVKSLGFEARQSDAFARVAEDLAEAQAGTVRLHAGSQTTVQIGAVIALAALLYAGLVWFNLGAAGVVMLLYVFARLMPRLSALQQSVQHIAHYLPSFDAMNTLLMRAGAAREPEVDGARLPIFERELRLDRVSYSYPNRETPPVRDLSLEIPASGFVAIVGPSGSGKSTIADLICGLVAPTSGRLILDGVPLDARSTQQWRQQVGYVEQDAFLFNTSIRSNLEWVRPGASDRELRDALSLASADFVFDLQDGLETLVGDRGAQLSGGERQRIALARALLRRPRVLVLDEPSSALDAVNERRVLDAIERLAGQTTIVLITHRLAAVRRADTIFVVEDGLLVEHGDWSTLTGQSASHFRALCDVQQVSLAASAWVPPA
jgi:ATP-binding cassette, subfamily C, bacterial